MFDGFSEQYLPTGCETLVARALPRSCGDVPDVWRPWARQVTGQHVTAPEPI
jgi:hypothetical protein